MVQRMTNGAVLGEARITYTLEQYPHETKQGSGVCDTTAWWLTRVVFDAGGEPVTREKVAIFDLDSEAHHFACWFSDMLKLAGAPGPISVGHRHALESYVSARHGMTRAIVESRGSYRLLLAAMNARTAFAALNESTRIIMESPEPSEVLTIDKLTILTAGLIDKMPGDENQNALSLIDSLNEYYCLNHPDDPEDDDEEEEEEEEDAVEQSTVTRELDALRRGDRK